MKTIAALLAAALAVATLVWLLGGSDGTALTAERNIAPVDAAPSAAPATSADLAAASTSAGDSARRVTDADGGEATTAPTASAATDRWLIVDRDTGAPIIDATVTCVDPSAEVRLPVVEGGAFEPFGVGPFLLEISSPEHAARWIVIDGDEPCAIALRRAGALEVVVVDEVGSPLAGIEARFESESMVLDDLRLARLAIAGDRVLGRPVRDVVSTLRGQTDDETFARFDPRHTPTIGPSDCMPPFKVGDDGAFAVHGMPSGIPFRVAVDDAHVAHSEPSGSLDSTGDEPRWVTEAREVRDGETTQFRIVRRGSSELTVSIAPNSTPNMDVQLQCVLARVDDASARGTPESTNLGRRRVSKRGSSPTVQWVGLEAGEYVVTLQWRRHGAHPSGKIVEYCTAQRRFTLAADESLDLGRLDPDPGLVEIDFVFVDEETRADVTAQVVEGTPRPFDLWSGFVGATDAGPFSRRAHTRMRAEGGFLRLLGWPSDGRALTVDGMSEALDETGWSFVLGPPIQIPPAESLRLRIEVAAARTHPCSLSIVRPANAAPFEVHEHRAAVRARRIDGSVESLLTLVAAADPADGLRTEARLAVGPWIVWELIEPYHDFSDDVAPASTAPAERDPSCYHVFGRFEVAADTPNHIRLEAVDVASAVVMHDAADQARLLECLRSSGATAQLDGVPDASIESWSPWQITPRTLTSLVIAGLPPNAFVRFDACDLEFRTGAPGSTVEVVVPPPGASESGEQNK